MKVLTPNLCCVLSPKIVCLECGLSMCIDCSRLVSSLPDIGPLFHEKDSQCPKGASLFTITKDRIYTFWKPGNSDAPPH